MQPDTGTSNPAAESGTALALDLTTVPGTVLRFCMTLVVLLTALHLATSDFLFLEVLRLDDALDPDAARSLFRLPREQSIGTWFSVVLLLSCAVTLQVISMHEFRARGSRRYAWLSLGLLFLVLSIDEQIGAHEVLSGYLRKIAEPDGLLFYTWVVPGSVFVGASGVLYWRFFNQLPREYVALFFGAGGIFVFGALLAEMLEGLAVSSLDSSRFALALSHLLQDPFEMAGASLFLYALLRYGVEELSWRRLGLGP